MAYLKIADVCQLLNKTNYPATQTVNGVTFTNNGDGTITVNGTATADTELLLGTLPVNKEHKLLLSGCPTGGSANTYNCYAQDNQKYRDTGSGLIYTKMLAADASVYISIKTNYAANNLVFKPQFFDLTEMYGKGKETTKTTSFKAKFPEELYDYSPRCWITTL